MIRRRGFLAGCITLLAAPLGAGAQQSAGKVWRLGWLGDGSRAVREANTLTPLREGLRELGYVEGKNLVIDARWSDGNAGRLAQHAAEFARLKVDVIVTHGSPGGVAAKKATETIPIVIASAGNLVGAGLAASLARPSGNVTGTSDQAWELTNKHLDVIAELLPGLQRVAVFWYRSNPWSSGAAETLQANARCRGLLAMPLAATSPDDVARLTDTALRQRARAVIVVQDAWTLSHRALIVVQHALGKRLPVFAARGCSPRRGARQLRSGHLRGLQARGGPRRQDPQGCPARGHPRRAADEIRDGDQHEDRQGPRPHDSAVAIAARGSGD